MSRLYERAGRIESEGTPARTGAVTFISAISPPGGDFAEPVTQASLRVAGGLWALDASLAHQRQFPAVDWDTSYSLYTDGTADWFSREGGPDWSELRIETIRLLQRDRELREIAGLVGVDALEDGDRLVLEGAIIAREFLIGQNAFHPHDAFSTVAKTYHLVKLLWEFMQAGEGALADGIGFEKLDLATVREAFSAVKTSASDTLDWKVLDAKEAISKMGDAMKRLDAPIARTYSGASSAAGPLLFVRSTRRAKLGEWVSHRGRWSTRSAGPGHRRRHRGHRDSGVRGHAWAQTGGRPRSP